MHLGLLACLLTSLVSAAAVPAENGHELNARDIEIVITSTPQEAAHKSLEHGPVSALQCGNCGSYACAYFDGANFWCYGISYNPDCPSGYYLACDHQYPPYYCRAKADCTKDVKVSEIIRPALAEGL